jgi:thiol-disulfide isomerase/thioredoxin
MASPRAGSSTQTTAAGQACVRLANEAVASASTTSGGEQLPPLTLPCLGADGQVRLADLDGPTVINIWASWCDPCRAELPAFQRYADSAGPRVRVIGVDSDDTRTKGQALVDDLHLVFPMLHDDTGSLRTALGRAALPVTVLVSGGRIAYVHNGPTLDDAGIAALVRRYLAGSG